MNIKYDIMNKESKMTPIVFMPSPFMTTTRRVFIPAIKLMQKQHPVVLLEPPGFGENSDVQMDKSMMHAQTYIDFIEDFCKHTHKNDFENQKIGIVGGGHSGCYTMEVAKNNSQLFEKVMLANFGYLGPFTHVKSILKKKGKESWFPFIDMILSLFHKTYTTPVVGPILHKMMTTPKQIQGQLKSHVFADTANITPEVVKDMQELSRMKRPMIL